MQEAQHAELETRRAHRVASSATAEYVQRNALIE
jgi:hypothetical protein